MKKIGDKENYTNSIFENIKNIDEYGQEYWYARELQKVLEYKDWRNFQKVIDKAVISAKNSVSDIEDWVVEVNKPIKTGKGKEEFIKDYKLSRYICYLIVQNAHLLVLKIWQNFTMRAIKAYIMGRPLMIFLKEKNYVIEKIF